MFTNIKASKLISRKFLTIISNNSNKEGKDNNNKLILALITTIMWILSISIEKLIALI